MSMEHLTRVACRLSYMLIVKVYLPPTMCNHRYLSDPSTVGIQALSFRQGSTLTMDTYK